MLGFSSPSPTAVRSLVRRSADEIYRHYRLIAGARGDGYSAVAYAGNLSVFTSSGTALESALDDLKGQIDSDFERLREQREGELPSRDELELALALAPHRITGPLRHLLEALNRGPDVSPQQLQRRSGAHVDTLLRDLVRFARTVADILALPLPKGSGEAALTLIAERIPLVQGHDEAWIFRQSFVAAAERHLAR